MPAEVCKKMNEFKTFHPFVNFAYFAAVIGFSVFLTDPFCLAASFVCAFAYSAILGGKKRLLANTAYLSALMIITTLVNFLLSHRGATILKYLPSGNPLTLESLAYGAASSVMFAAIICCFQCFGDVMTSDKFMYLFGRITPSLSLVLSMTLRFVSKFKMQAKSIALSQKSLNNGEKNVVQRGKNAIAALSALVTWALENAVDTSESMKSRGYGLDGRTTYSPFEFDRRDGAALLFITASSVYTLAGILGGVLKMSYFPHIAYAALSQYGISVRAVYLLLCAMPVAMEIEEEVRWRKLKSKI